MPKTYEPIATYTIASAINTYTFSSIPSTYTDLKLVVNNAAISGGTDNNLTFRLNGDTGSNYSMTNVGARALSTTPFSGRQSTTSGNINWYTAIGTQAGIAVADFMNYSNTTTFKTILVNGRVNEGNATYSGVEVLVNLWRATPAAITSLTLFTVSGNNFANGTTFTLYGIKAA
jgi:hypothetical protein